MMVHTLEEENNDMWRGECGWAELEGAQVVMGS